jgi:hypothetical protein
MGRGERGEGSAGKGLGEVYGELGVDVPGRRIGVPPCTSTPLTLAVVSAGRGAGGAHLDRALGLVPPPVEDAAKGAAAEAPAQLQATQRGGAGARGARRRCD